VLEVNQPPRNCKSCFAKMSEDICKGIFAGVNEGWHDGLSSVRRVRDKVNTQSRVNGCRSYYWRESGAMRLGLEIVAA
jgi:hypothetical protein